MHTHYSSLLPNVFATALGIIPGKKTRFLVVWFIVDRRVVHTVGYANGNIRGYIIGTRNIIPKIIHRGTCHIVDNGVIH